MHPAVDLFSHRGLLLCSARNLCVHRIDSGDQFDRIAQKLSRLIGLSVSALSGLRGLMHGTDYATRRALEMLNHSVDFLGTALSTTGQGSYFISNHRKPAPGSTGTGCFNGRIECQKIGLFSNRANDIQHGNDRSYIVLKNLHGDTTLIQLHGQSLNSSHAAIDYLPRVSGLSVGLDGRVCSILRADRHFLRRR
ncbi:hypothetical protein D3C85_1341970 [compost metagenome]